MEISISQATQWVVSYFGIDGTLSVLPGEVDLNYRVKTPLGENYIFKVSEPGAEANLIDMQMAMLRHLEEHAPDLSLPRIVPTTQGETCSILSSPGQGDRILRMLTWVDGRVWAEISPQNEHLRISLGKLCGQMSKALQGFDHPAAYRFIKWDPLQLEWISPKYESVFASLSPEKASDLSDLIRQVLELFRSKVRPYQEQLRKSINHNDANDYNILVDQNLENPKVSCLVDFGDSVFTYTINELAIAITYGAMGQEDPLSAACEIVKGYQEAYPLTELECEALYPLVLARLAISIYCAAENQQAHPENEYLQISSKPAISLLKKFLGTYSANFVHYRFREICGFEPCSFRIAFDKWLQNKPAFSALMHFPSKPDQIALLDLGVGSSELGNHSHYRNRERLQKRIRALLFQKDAQMGIGGYAEIRPIYTSDAFVELGNQGPRWRTLHLGLDIWAHAGAKVFAPLAGEVEFVQFNGGEGNYGYTLILKHSIPDGGEFYTLYGHLAAGVMDRWKVGEKVWSGVQIASLGNPEENGNWPPHLHFQVLLDLMDNQGDFPGVAYPEESQIWQSICPDPSPFIPFEITTPAPHTRRNKAEILIDRKKMMGKSLSISYDQPLHMVRGQMQYLIDASGRRYLDLVNNVAHVGHEHPRVVEAAQRQQGLLNTNTRYLHEGLLTFAEELLATLPPELCVCHFVNSGSEANELALRMAKSYTGQQDMIAIQVGYHGNTGACIDVSSYKFDGKGGQGAPPFTHIVPMPDVYRGIYRNPDDAGHFYANFVREAIETIQEQGRGVAGFIGESILSCGGQIVLPSGYLQEVYSLVRNAGGICIADEVQVGVGRVGEHFWGFQLQGVVPDIMTIGKPIGNGHPLAAVVCTRAVADAFANGMEYFSTFGGNPVSCAIGQEVLKVVKEENLQDRAFELGQFFKAELTSLQVEFPIIGDVRGQGLFLGIEFVSDPIQRTPAAKAAHYVANRMREQGILISTDGPDHNVLKIKPPMCISPRDVEFVLDNFRNILTEDAMSLA